MEATAVAGSMRGPRTKIERAKKHIADLDAALDELVFSHSTHPHVILTEDDPEADNKIYKAGEIPCVPDVVGAIAADTIHNLRVALDLLFSQLIERTGNTPASNFVPYFPTGYTRQSFEASCNSEVKRLVGKDAFDLLRATEAYRGGNGDAIWCTHQLDIEDKHRVVYALGFNLGSLTLPAPKMPEWSESNPITLEQHASLSRMMAEMMDGLFWKPASILFPLKEGDTLLIGMLEPANDPKFRLDVAFAQPQIVQAQSVLPTVAQLGQVIEDTVESFAPLF
jgi:hypothetical protein